VILGNLIPVLTIIHLSKIFFELRNGPEQDTLRHSAIGATASGFCIMLADALQ
jgi:hypothetical protein